MEFLSLAALEVTILTTSSVAIDKSLIKITFTFQWGKNICPPDRMSIFQPILYNIILPDFTMV